MNGQSFLAMLEEVVAPLVRQEMWFQQDGALPHMPARALLQDRFEERVISCLTPISWPTKSPDLSCLDYWLWGVLFWVVVMAELRRSLPTTLAELKTIVEDFSKSL